jgi:hypothetical protein
LRLWGANRALGKADVEVGEPNPLAAEILEHGTRDEELSTHVDTRPEA